MSIKLAQFETGTPFQEQFRLKVLLSAPIHSYSKDRTGEKIKTELTCLIDRSEVNGVSSLLLLCSSLTDLEKNYPGRIPKIENYRKGIVVPSKNSSYSRVLLGQYI